jgi:large subunit ribosomal protein L4
MELVVLNTSGKETGKKVTLDETVFGIEPNKHAVYLEVKQYLAAQRQGTHKSKERSEITGSTKKLKKQKGSGSARYGDIKSPVFRGGGRIFGPKPRDYRFKLNKALKRLAKKSVLSQKMRDNSIKIVEGLSISAPKTKDFITILNALALLVSRSVW